MMLKWFKQSAEGGDPRAWLHLAKIYRKKEKPGRARKCLREGARCNDVESIAEYGTMLVNGEGGPRKRKTGIVLLKRAARRGNGAANHMLGILCKQGDEDKDKIKYIK